MSSLEFKLHDSQLEIFDNPAKFKVVVAGRRFGKSFLARVMLALEALKDENEDGYSLIEEEVWYVAPTFENAKRNMWIPLKNLLKMEKDGGLISAAHENTGVLTLVNGRRISLKGADRPDMLRGSGLSFVALDEYAFMKEGVFEMIIGPALARAKGGALFIGSPEGKNHFYELYQKALAKAPGYEDWEAFHFESLKNPTLPPDYIAQRIATMSVAQARQEFGASFNSGGGAFLREEWWKRSVIPADADYYIAVDLAGFSNAATVKKGVLKVKDDHAIAVVKCNPDGWFVEEIKTGQWDVRRTALEIVSAYSKYRPVKLGIEKGMAKNAVMPYLEDEMKRLNRYFTVWDLFHGGNHKEDRIRWAIQGRLEKGRLLLNTEENYDENGSIWQRKLIEQGNDFPSSLAHDDMLDALAYIDQLADTVYYEGGVGVSEDWVPLDTVSGF